MGQGPSMRWFILLVGAALLIAGVAGLLMPVSITANGTSLGCGNAVISDLSAAEQRDLANGVPTHFDPFGAVIDCKESLSTRRLWTIPLVAFGAVTFFTGLPRKRRPT
jgi:hypothetical protein